MFFNRNYIPAVPIREEQRISEEEELARALKREARIFFPDKKLPDLDEEEPLNQSQENYEEELEDTEETETNMSSDDLEDTTDASENADTTEETVPEGDSFDAYIEDASEDADA